MSFPKVVIRPRRSMALIAVLAIAMVITSYVFVVLLAAACVYVPYLVAFSSDSPGGQSILLLLFGVVIAAAMLWSLVPRRDKFMPPGPLLDRSSQPRLFAELDSIAASLDETLPQEVYFIGEVNAWVADRGGVMGFGSRRVMGLGLPLLSILTLSQFRAVLAHEFAHYYGGDTSLGPWVYKTQTAIIRTFQNIGSLRQLARFWAFRIMYLLVATVLNWYFMLFLRATNFVSRKKEYRADELACLIAGPQALIEGLRAIHGGTLAWQSYWNSELVPVLSSGSIPQIGDGFARFVAVPNISEQIERNLAHEIREAKSNPYNTHPPLRDRIAAAQKLLVGSQQEDMQPAHSLLDNPEATELRFVETLNPSIQPDTLKRVTWDEVGTKVMVPRWRKFVGEYAAILQGVTAESLPDAIQKLPEIGSEIADPKGMLLTREQRTIRAGQLFGMGFGLALLHDGWELRTQPGIFYLQRGNDQLNPFLSIESLESGKLSREDWVTRCRELGISRVELLPQAGAPGGT